MIVQITMTKNECFLLKEMLEVWKNYADAFIFFDDGSTDETYDFLMHNKEKYNILKVLRNEQKNEELWIETNNRQLLYDEALKYSNKIICMDSDEYLDGNMTKEQLEDLLDKNPDTTFNLDWIQYTSQNEIRVDGPWKVNTKDRIGSYSTRAFFQFAQMHSTHLPYTAKNIYIKTPDLFIAHLQWLDKQTVAIKQYFWKVTDYLNRLKFNIPTLPPQAYDESVANFNWEYKKFHFPLKIDSAIYSKQSIEDNYKLKFIKENTIKYNIPNLNDWGLNLINL